MKGNFSTKINNTIELSQFGKLHPEILMKNTSIRSQFYSYLYELSGNDLHNFNYTVTTYKYIKKEELSSLSNLVEIYQNECYVE